MKKFILILAIGLIVFGIWSLYQISKRKGCMQTAIVATLTGTPICPSDGDQTRIGLLNKGEQCGGFTGKIGDCRSPYKCEPTPGVMDQSICR